MLGLTMGGVAFDGRRGLRAQAESPVKESSARLFFTSGARSGMVRADGSDLKWFDFQVPLQETWQPGPVFADGKRAVFFSMEKRRDGPGRPFDEYYWQTPTHLWICDLTSGELTEIATRDRMASFYSMPLLLPGEERMLVQVLRDGAGQIWNMNLDGSDPLPFTRSDDGFPYGLSANSDGSRVAFHTSGPSPHGYRIWTSDLLGNNRHLVAGHAAHLYFGPVWSPDDQWLLYQDCQFRTDPGHDWSDVCVGRPDGSEHRALTTGQAAWFGATYGGPARRGGGSNLPQWTPDGQILFSRRLPGSRVAWQFQTDQRDVDHFNREWRPEQSRGGAEICRLDPGSGRIERLTETLGGQWDFRASASLDNQAIVFCRCATGELPALWVLFAGDPVPRSVTRGWGDEGADHPRWIPG